MFKCQSRKTKRKPKKFNRPDFQGVKRISKLAHNQPSQYAKMKQSIWVFLVFYILYVKNQPILQKTRCKIFREICRIMGKTQNSTKVPGIDNDESLIDNQ